MSMPGNLQVERADLQQAAGILDTVAASLGDSAPGLRTRPDAGTSTDEVATALATLAEAVGGLADHVGSVAEATRTSAADFTTTDQSVRDAMQQRGGGIGP